MDFLLPLSTLPGAISPSMPLQKVKKKFHVMSSLGNVLPCTHLMHVRQEEGKPRFDTQVKKLFFCFSFFFFGGEKPE